jgi:hypothetical protein
MAQVGGSSLWPRCSIGLVVSSLFDSKLAGILQCKGSMRNVFAVLKDEWESFTWQGGSSYNQYTVRRGLLPASGFKL